MMRDRPARAAKLHLRLSADAKRTLQRAAEAANCSVSEFALQSALDKAEETLTDRTRFELDEERRLLFLEVLDSPPHDHPRLQRLLREPSVFESSEQG